MEGAGRASEALEQPVTRALYAVALVAFGVILGCLLVHL